MSPSRTARGRVRRPSAGWRPRGRRCSASPRTRSGRRNHFFELGGASLSALRLAIALDRAVSFKDLTPHPILADQAALIAERIERGVLAAPASVPSGRYAAIQGAK